MSGRLDPHGPSSSMRSLIGEVRRPFAIVQNVTRRRTREPRRRGDRVASVQACPVVAGTTVRLEPIRFTPFSYFCTC